MTAKQRFRTWNRRENTATFCTDLLQPTLHRSPCSSRQSQV